MKSLLLLAALVSAQEPDYAALRRDCAEKSSPNCCTASVDAMEKGRFRLALDGKCPPSMSPNVLKCVDSYKWCAPAPRTSAAGASPAVFDAELPSSGYYRDLDRRCETRSSVGCCKSSVEAMRRSGYRLAENDLCPKGQSRNMMRCADSFRWCEPPRPARKAKKKSSKKN